MESLKKDEYDPETEEGIYEKLDEVQNEINENEQSSTQTTERNTAKVGRLQELGISTRTFSQNGASVTLKEYQGEVNLFGKYERWIVTVANDNTIVQAEPLNTVDGKYTY